MYQGVITRLIFKDKSVVGYRVKSIDTGRSFNLTDGFGNLSIKDMWKRSDEIRGTLVDFTCSEIGSSTENPKEPKFNRIYL